MRAWREAAAWWLVLVAVWLATLTTYSAQELVTAAVLSTPLALVVPLARRNIDANWRPRGRWLRWLPGVVWGVLHDSVAVLWLARDRDKLDAGEFRRIPLAEDPDPDRAAAHRALATAALSATPGAVVVDGPDAESSLLVHALPIRPTGLERAVRR